MNGSNPNFKQQTPISKSENRTQKLEISKSRNLETPKPRNPKSHDLERQKAKSETKKQNTK